MDDDRAAQAHGLALPAEGDAKRVHDVGLEGDAVLRHLAHWGDGDVWISGGMGRRWRDACMLLDR